MPANYIIEDHQELLNVGVKTHPEIDSELNNLLARVAVVEAKHWHTFQVQITSAMVDGQILDAVTGKHVIHIPLGIDPVTSLQMNYAGYEKLTVFMSGMRQDEGQAFQLVGNGLSIGVILPDDPTQWHWYRTGGISVTLEWFR